MSIRDCLIIERQEEWVIVAGSTQERLAANVATEELVTCVRLVIKLAGLKSPNCLIAPNSTSCFFSSIHVDAEPETRNRNGLLYELESHVPLDAEAMVADFVVAPTMARRHANMETTQVDPLQNDASALNHDPDLNHDPEHSGEIDSSSSAASLSPSQNKLIDTFEQDNPNGKSVMAVSIEFQRWRKLIDALEAAGILVRSLVPSALLATRVLARQQHSPGLTELLLFDEAHCDAMILDGDSIRQWKHLINESALRRHRVLDTSGLSEVIVVDADENQSKQVDQLYSDIAINRCEQTLPSLWKEGATLALTKPSPRWFELCRDQLGPSDPLRPILPQLRLVTAAMILFLMFLVAGGWWRTKQIENEIDRITAEQRAAFQEAFPCSRVPAALLRRVRSEHTKLRGSRGASTEIAAPQSATLVLRELLAGLPDSIRFRIESLNIANGQVDLEIQVRTAVDAGALATALEARGFRVEPPITTRKDAQSFDSILEARWIGRPTTTEPSEEASNSKSKDAQNDATRLNARPLSTSRSFPSNLSVASNSLGLIR